MASGDDRRRRSGSEDSKLPPPAQPSALSPQSFPGWPPSFTAALERLGIAVRRPAGRQHAGEVRSRARGRAIEFADYRAYTPGDDPKLVDWRAYGRLGRLYLKQYEEERSRSVTILVDASASMDWGDDESHKGLYARRLAAALAWIAANRHEQVRTYLLRDGAAVPLTPVTNRASTVTLYRELGAARESGATGLAATVRRLAPSISAGPVILLTDLLDSSWSEALAVLAPAGEATLIQLLAPDEWEPPLGEEVELVDSESGDLRPTRLGPVELAAYRTRLYEFLDEAESRCRKLGIVRIALNTSTPLQETVLRGLPAAGLLAG